MNISEAAQLLRRAYRNAPDGKQKVGLQLFGIKYAHELIMIQDTLGISRAKLLNMLVKDAEVPSTYTTEIRIAIYLAEFVEVKTDNLWF